MSKSTLGSSHSCISLSVCFPATVWFDADAGCFASYCPLLNLHSAGKTQTDAARALESAIKMYISLVCPTYQELDRE